jgi:hypothetical protein
MAKTYRVRWLATLRGSTVVEAESEDAAINAVCSSDTAVSEDADPQDSVDFDITGCELED